jgi:hypothetical protein
MGVATFTQVLDTIPLGGSNKLYVGTLTMSSSYATNGDTIDWPGDWAATGGVTDARVQLSDTGGRVLEYDGTNGKVKAYQDNGTATAAALPEVANATNLSAIVAECWIILPG